jgi:putative ABC transport system permease protein
MELIRDLRLVMRSLARARGFTTSAVLTLAFGLALAATVVAVVNAYIVRSLPYPAAERLYQVFYAEPGQEAPRNMERLDWASLSDIVEHPIAWDLDMFYLLGGDYPEQAPGAWVTRDFVEGLGVRPALGRNFRPEEFQPGAPQVALISHELWMRRFGGDSAVLGRQINGYVSDRPRDPESFTIIGVLDANFWHINPFTQIFTPLRAETHPYYLRLREGVPPAVAAHRVAALVRDGGAAPADWPGPQVRSVHAEYVSRMKPMLLAIAAAVGVVLLIACSNVALLTVLRGMGRRKEIAVRLALGARRSQVARLLFLEAGVLSAAAAALGVLLAAGIMRALAPAIERNLGRRVPGGLSALSLDWPVILVVLGVAILIAGGLALTPMWLAGRFSFVPALRQVRGGGDGGSAKRARFILIGAEVAGSLALLGGAGLMVRTVTGLLDVELGLDTRQVLSAQVAVREQSYPDATSRSALLERLLAATADVPQTSHVALSNPSPLVSYNPRPVRVSDDAAPVRVETRAIAGNYFDLLGVPLLRGRPFDGSDRGRAGVAIVSESAAELLWPGADPIGRTLRIVEDAVERRDTVTVTRTIVGVVRDVRQTPTDSMTAEVYLPLLQTPSRFVAIVARTARPLVSWEAEVRRAVTAIDREVAVSNPRDVSAERRDQLSRPRFLILVFSLFGVFATLLGVMGLYAVIAYAVRQREHEVAVRIAVGADGRSITSLFVREGMLVTALGLVAGVGGAMSVGRLLESQLFGIEATDPATIAGATIVLAAAAFVAVWWPARRAAATDPVIALKGEV